MMKNTWSFLQPGDSVDVIAPASLAPANKLHEGVKWLESLGLLANVPEKIIQGDLFFASPLENQLEDFKKALFSDSKAIWCLRGGYGSMRLIPHLKKLTPPPKPKLFIGFSDITSLHLFLNQEWNWATIHGRNLSQMSIENGKLADRKVLKDIITGKSQSYIFKGLKPLNQSAQEEKTIEGKIIGGNLRIIQSSLGTHWQIRPKGKILFIEDVGERGYSVDRMLEQLGQALLLHKGLKAVVFGDFTESFEPDGRDLIMNALKRFAQSVPYPVLSGMKAGHGDKYNYPVPFLTNSNLILGKKPSLECFYGGKE